MEIAAALSALKTAFDLAKIGVAARDDSKVKAALLDINDKLLETHNASFALQEKNQALSNDKALLTERIRALEEEVRAIKNLAAELEKYVPHHTIRGGLCLRDKASIDEAKQPIYLCINCSARGEITYLQPGKSNAFLNCRTHGDIGSDERIASPEEMLEAMRSRASRLP